MHIGIFYFSATGVTDLISKHIATVLEREGHSTQLKNILSPKNREPEVDFSEFNFVFFGFPVFGGRPPSIAEEWMSTLDGKNQKCSMFFTYGARDLEWAHQITYYLLTRSNFHVVLSAEFIGRHSFNAAGWKLAEDRPNESDFEVATKFTLQSLTHFQQDHKFDIDLTDFSYQVRENKERTGEWAKFYPSRVQNECSMCYLCENECPVSAFDAKLGKTNRQLCTACMHCVTFCPDNLIKTGDVLAIFTSFIDRLGLSREVVDKKTSKILTSYPD